MIREAFSTALLLITCLSGAQEYRGPKCVGSFCIDPKLTTVDSLLKRLGEPAGRKSKAPNYCYQAKNGQAYLFIETIGSEPDRAGDVLLSYFRNCMHMTPRLSAEDLQAWKTTEGIGLGSAEADVLKMYGKPSGGWKVDSTNSHTMNLIIHGYHSGDRVPDVGDKAITYGGNEMDLRLAIFGLRKGKVVWINLSRNE